MEKKYKLNKKRILICVVGLIAVIGFIYLLLQILFPPHIVLTSDVQEVEINSQVDYQSFIEKVRDGDIKDVKVDSKDVQLNHLGNYTVIYQFKDEQAELTLKVIDTIAPKVQTKKLKIAQNQNIKAEDLIEKITDATKTTVSFQKDYDFSKTGKLDVNVVVEDEGGNQTVEKITIEIVEDKTAPTIIVNSFSVNVGEKVDLLNYALVKDDYDQNPKVTVEKNNFDIHKTGTYSIKYIAKDFAGNQSQKAVKVTVKNKDSKTEKVVYLTFDDGPSKYTSEILEILKKYNCKATFFVTGQNPSYYHYIKVANEQGHTIGLHTYSHSYKKVYSSIDAYFDDLEKVGNLAKEYIGFVPKYIRFPGGGSNTVSRKYTKGIMTQLTKMVVDKGYQYYDWNAENGDGYTHITKSEMLKRATSSSQDQIMILMHDANGKEKTVEILPTVIEYYQKRGYVFKAIDENAPVFHQHVNN